MAFREKMVWGSAITTLAIWGWYFLGFVNDLRAGTLDQGEATGDFASTVVLLVIVQMAVAIALSIAQWRDSQRPADDRERAIALYAYRAGHFTLSACVVMLMLAGPILLRVANEWTPAPPPGLTPVLLGNTLLFSLVLAELVYSAAQLIRYRLGG